MSSCSPSATKTHFVDRDSYRDRNVGGLTTDARTVAPVSVGIFIGDAKFGVLRDRDGQIEAIGIGRQFKPLGLFTTTRAAVAAIIEASNQP